MCVQIYIYKYICIYICIYSTYQHMHVHICINTFIHIYIHAYMCPYVYIEIIHIYIYISLFELSCYIVPKTSIFPRNEWRRRVEFKQICRGLTARRGAGKRQRRAKKWARLSENTVQDHRWCSVLQFVESVVAWHNQDTVREYLCCSVLQCVAVCCSVLQCVVARHSKDTVRDHLWGSVLQWVAVCCDKNQAKALWMIIWNKRVCISQTRASSLRSQSSLK
jgi:hypothetical protein